MSAAWLPAVALGLRLWSGPAAIDWGLGAQAEAAAGSIPVSIDDSFSPAVESFFELRTGMRLRSPTSTLSLRYAPRLFARFPATEQFGRPLLLHTLLLDADTRVTPRWALDLSASGSVGEVSYSGTQELFGSNVGVLETSVVSVKTGSVHAASIHRTSRRNTFQVSLSAGAQAPLYPEDPLPSSRTAGAALSDEYRLTRVDTISFGATADYFLRDDEDPLLLAGASATLRRRLDGVSSISFGAGATATPEELPTVFPTGLVAYGTGWGGRGQPWTFHLSGGTQVVFDPLANDVRRVGFLSSDVGTTFPSSLRTGASLTAQTSISEQPAERTPFETSIHLALPSSYMVSDRFELTFGARSSLMGPHLSHLADGRRQGQFLLYVGFRQHDGTAPSRGNWVL